MNTPPEQPLSEESGQTPIQTPTEHTPTEETPQNTESHPQETSLAPVPASAVEGETIEPGDATAPVISDAPESPLESETVASTDETAPYTSEGQELSETDRMAADSQAQTEPIETDATESVPVEQDEGFDGEPVATALPATVRSGIFVPRWMLIAATAIIVLAILLTALLTFINRPQDPPTDWVASYTPPAGTSSSGKILYYLHWTNQNGALTGQLKLAANPNGQIQSLTVPATGLYNREDHLIYMVITISGQQDTLTGNINSSNDTLMLNEAGATSQDSQIIFHTGSSKDYDQATKKLTPVATPVATPAATPASTAKATPAAK